MKALTLSLILSLSLSSCEWIKSLGPEEKFFCKINGEKFRPDKDNSPIGGWGSNPIRIEFDKENGWLAIFVRNIPNSISIITQIPKEDGLLEKEYLLSNDLTKSKAYYNLNFAEENFKELISESGKFTITKIEGYNIWGTFEFVCRDSITKKDYKITEGEFNNLKTF
jgi:hypothetical protein